ncbi:Fasciclin domain-containing protein [Cephalotus follicularis]|uniref:Fasciclin domain-containing protein n=1 Tax=Cephalotus follicularis TaxID=3775 RepID=A0A1Q3B6M0_CEPFO|nr:Fasciclin domain-containing protein [Cephalotus follicularis]
MAPKASSPLFLALFLVFSSTSTAFNITKLFTQYPDYVYFNDLLTQTKLDQEINSRQTITFLALTNDSIDTLSGRPVDEVKKILSNHVILDYYDVMKLKKLNKKSTILTTLYQTTGVAQNQQGFLNVTISQSGDVLFGSAVKNAVLNSKLVGSVLSNPYNISILQVSEPIIAPTYTADQNVATPPPPPPPPQTTASPPKAPQQTAPAPKAKVVDADAPAAAPADDDAPSEAPTSSSPATSPTADVPAADTPSQPDSPADTSPISNKSGSSMMTASGVGIAVVMGLVMNFGCF